MHFNYEDIIITYTAECPYSIHANTPEGVLLNAESSILHTILLEVFRIIVVGITN
jgi:hypothetical protein